MRSRFFWALGGIQMFFSLIAYDGISSTSVGVSAIGPILGIIAGLCTVGFFVSGILASAFFSRREL